MANTFAPFGFRQFGTLEGNSPTYGLTRRYLASSDTNSYFTGDVVQISTSIPGFITLPASGTTTGNPILGVFAGCEFFSPTVGRVVWSSFFTASVGSSSPCNAYVIEGEDNIFLAQASTEAVIGSSVIGMNIGFTSSDTGSAQKNGNTTTGISNIALKSTSVSANSSLPFRIVDTSSAYFPPGTNGADGTTAGAIMVVAFNNSMRRSLTAAST